MATKEHLSNIACADPGAGGAAAGWRHLLGYLLARFRRFAGVNISKCLKIKARVKKVCTTAGLID